MINSWKRMGIEVDIAFVRYQPIAYGCGDAFAQQQNAALVAVPND